MASKVWGWKWHWLAPLARAGLHSLSAHTLCSCRACQPSPAGLAPFVVERDSNYPVSFWKPFKLWVQIVGPQVLTHFIPNTRRHEAACVQLLFRASSVSKSGIHQIPILQIWYPSVPTWSQGEMAQTTLPNQDVPDREVVVDFTPSQYRSFLADFIECDTNKDGFLQSSEASRTPHDTPCSLCCVH